MTTGTPRPLDGGNPARLVTLRTAAEALAVSERTVRRFINAGYLEAYRIGPRAIRVSVGDVNRMIQRMPAGTSYVSDGTPAPGVDPDDAPEDDADDAERRRHGGGAC
jgi:excisionase family DNA binding protein